MGRPLSSRVVDRQGEQRTEGGPPEDRLDATSRAQLIARIAGLFMSLGPEAVDRGIDEALRAVGEFGDVDRAYAFRLQPGPTLRNTHEWCAPGVEPEIQHLQQVPAETVPWFLEQILRGDVVNVPRVGALPDEAEREQEHWLKQDIQSLICVPLESAGEVVGFVGLDSVRRARVWSERAVELLRSVGGIIVGALDHRETQQALLESRTQLDQAQGVAEIGVWTWDIATGEVTLSDHAFRLYQIDRDSFQGTLEESLRVIHPDDLETARQATERALREKTGYEIRFRTCLPDGQTRLIQCHAQTILGDDGEPERVVGMIQDITASQVAEDAQRRLSTAIEQVADAVMITDAEGVIRYVNPSLEQVTGHHRAELLGRDRRLLRHPEQDADAYAAIAVTVNRGRVWSGRVRVRRRDGSAVLMDTTVSPVQDAMTGAIRHHVAVQRDVTREAAVEEQLRQVQKMEAVGMLAGGIAHDFNNLLIAIIGHSDLLLMRHGDNPDVSKHVEEISKAGERARALTGQLLAFSRKQVLRPRALDLGKVLTELAGLLRRVIGEDIELIVEEQSEPRIVEADPSQMEQVVINLATNARDAMPAGGVLELSLEHTTLARRDAEALDGLEPGPYAVLTVKDNGLGMDEETRARIFEPFYTTKGVGQGTGLGLSTAYGIVRQSGGTIDVESEVGGGTLFRVYLPAVPDMMPEEEAEPARPAAAEGSEVVLVVEDDDSVARIVRSTLSAHGYEVLYAENGRHALEVADEHGSRVDLLFTDVVMPEMGGVQLAAELTSRHPELKVLYCSGYTDSALMQRGALVRGVDLLQKPFSPADLVHRVRATLDGTASTP